jgi:drug/metabolite transporter (DMT)-like permease
MAMVIGAGVLFAINGTVSKLVLDAGLGSLPLVQIRCASAAVLFLLIATRTDRPGLRVHRDEVLLLVVYGVVGLAMAQWLYLVAIGRMPVSIALLLEFTAPLLVALWVRLVRHDDVHSRIWVALALCLGGLAMVAEIWDGLTLDGVGLLAAGASAVALATYYLLGERALAAHGPVSLAAISFSAASVLWAIVQPWWDFPADVLTQTVDLDAATEGFLGGTVPVWLLVGWVVVLGTVAPFWLVLGGLGRIGATRTGLLGTLEPVLAGVVAWAVLGQVLSTAQVIGGTIVLIGIIIAETARSQPPPPT